LPYRLAKKMPYGRSSLTAAGLTLISPNADDEKRASSSVRGAPNGGGRMEMTHVRAIGSVFVTTCGKLLPMRISHTLLSPKALRGIVQEFVTRDGTDLTSVEKRIEAVLRQLSAGRVEIHFDEETETCNILPVT
jgi:uncharacterized protein YheU (UPF0270 family)